MINLSLSQISQELRSGKRTPEQLLLFCQERVFRYNPLLNALAQVNLEASFELLRGPKVDFAKNTLAGIPWTMKDMFAVEGLRQTCGNVKKRDHIAKNSAPIAASLLAARAPLVGLTNIPEMGFWPETDNKLFGLTKNPYNKKRTAGGSSGGEAVAVATGMSFFGIGSDIDGSIRGPAHFCGVFGHKPSRGVVSSIGHFPLTEVNVASRKKDPFMRIGPLTRHASDLRVVLQELIQVRPAAELHLLRSLPADFLKRAPLDLSRLTVWVLEDPNIHFCSRVLPETKQAVLNSARYLEGLGAKVRPLRSNLFENAGELWFAMLKDAHLMQFSKELAQHTHLPYAREMLKGLVGRGEHTWPALITSFLDDMLKGESWNTQRELAALNRAHELHGQLTSLLGEHGVILAPIFPQRAFNHRQSWLAPFDFLMSGLWNALDLPSTAVPVDPEHELPLGIQVVGGDLQDDLCIQVAEALEAAFGGWREPVLTR